MSDITYEIWQDGICVVSVIDDDDARARREIMHYVAQYMQDGPLQIRGPNVKAIFDHLASLTPVATPAPSPNDGGAQ